MRFIVSGDFHGKFDRKKIEKIIKKSKAEFFVSLGDYCPFSYRKLWFEYCYGKDVELWEVIGKKETARLVTKDVRAGESVLRELNRLSIPVYTVVGNLDYARLKEAVNESKFSKSKSWNWYEQDFFSPMVKKYKNIQRFDYSFIDLGEFVLIGGYGGTFPGHVMSKNYKKSREKMDLLFKSNKGKKVIFVSHNVPNNTKVDLITDKDAHKTVKGKHYGSKLIRRLIEKYQPLMHFGGHIHEGTGTDKLGKTLLVNPGSFTHGEYAIVDIEKGKIKVNLKKI